jgi:hypothetical protein
MVPELAKTRQSQGFSRPGDAPGEKTRKNTAVSACRGSALRKLSPDPDLGGIVNRRDLVQAVSTQTGVERRQVDSVLLGFTQVVTAVVSKGEPV